MVGPKPSFFRRETRGDVIVIVGVAIGLFRHGDDFGPECAQERDFFRRLRFGDDNHGAIPLGMADDGEADAGVAGRAFNDRVAGPELAALFGIEDDAQGGAVLDGATGVQPFCLAQNFTAGQFGQPAEPDQRGAANVFFNARIFFSAHSERDFLYANLRSSGQSTSVLNSAGSAGTVAGQIISRQTCIATTHPGARGQRMPLAELTGHGSLPKRVTG